MFTIEATEIRCSFCGRFWFFRLIVRRLKTICLCLLSIVIICCILSRLRWKIEEINTFLCNLLQKQLENRKFQSGIIDILVTERYNENSLLIKWMILRGDNMELSYNSLWKILIDKKMKKETLCWKAKISTHTINVKNDNKCASRIDDMATIKSFNTGVV